MVIFLGDWEMDVTRSGDIDTDGEPIGWKIVGIGEGGSVLCEKPNGQRRRYSFGDGANGKPSGEAWERLLNVVADYARNVGIVGPRGEKIKEAWKAYEAAQSAEPIASHTEVSAADQVKIMEGMLEDVKAERDEALRELADERSISDQVIDERNATIAELRSELDETRTERHAYKSRLREFCQRLVDMVGAEGPEDVQGMLDKVNAELHRLKQNIDSMSANLADKEGFLNSAGDEIERLTKERDEAVAELRSLSTISGQTIAELRAKLERPEMPEVVRSLIGDIIREVPGRFSQAIAAVEAHYAPPFRIDKLGVYATEKGNPWEVIYIDPKGGVVARHETTKLLENFHVSGACKGGPFSLTKFLRPLEG
jgi:uncharacterized coiled-coil DUF342 family protein